MSIPVDQLIKEWATSVLPGIPVSLATPAAQNSGRGVSFYLMEVRNSPTHLTSRAAPLELSLRYLVTSWAETPEEAHQILTDLAFAALANRDVQVELDAVSMETWTALGVPPSPSFVVRVPLRQARTEPPTKMVRERLKLSPTTLVPFHGLIVGPGEIPLANSLIDIPGMRLSTQSDYRGQFHFVAVPSEGSKTIRVRAKGRELTVVCEGVFSDESDPFVIHFTPLEN